MAINATQFQLISNSLGFQYRRLRDMQASSAATDVLSGTVQNALRIDALPSRADRIALLKPFDDLERQASQRVYREPGELFIGVLNALSNQFSPQTTRSFIINESIIITDDFRDLLVAATGNTEAVPNANVEPDTNVSLATFTITGPTSGNFAPGTPVNLTLFGAVQCEVEVTTAIPANGGTPVVATLTLTNAAGNSVTRTVNIPDGSIVGTMIDVGTNVPADRFRACTAITITGGGGSGAFRVRTKKMTVTP